MKGIGVVGGDRKCIHEKRDTGRNYTKRKRESYLEEADKVRGERECRSKAEGNSEREIKRVSVPLKR